MAQYGYNTPGYTGYKREQAPYTTYSNSSSYAGSHHPDHQYVTKPVLTTSTYVVEEKMQVRETRRPMNKGYYRPASNMDFHPPKIKEYVTKVGSHPLPSYTHQSHRYDEPKNYGSSAWKNPGDSNYGYSEYNSYGGNNSRNSNGGWSRGVAGHAAPLTRTTNDIRDFFEGNDIRDVIEAAREDKYEHSPPSLGKADTHHQSRQEYGRGHGGFTSLTRPYVTGEPPRTFIKKY